MHQIDWHFVYTGIAIMALGVIFAFWFVYKMTIGSKKIASKILGAARKIATRRWYVKERVLLQAGTGLELIAEGGVRWKVYIPFRPAHPDIELIHSLEHMDIVEFQVVETVMDCALETETCGYLRLKKVGHFA
jgi:hypothetical protein